MHKCVYLCLVMFNYVQLSIIMFFPVFETPWVADRRATRGFWAFQPASARSFQQEIELVTRSMRFFSKLLATVAACGGVGPDLIPH